MGDIFCLIVLENGSRRKLKLQSGTYDELLAGLAGMFEVDSKNTQVQMFDTDLDDLLDLLPGDVVPNKAEIHVFQKTALASCSPGDDARLCSPPPLPVTSSVAFSAYTSGGEALLDTPDAKDQRPNIGYPTESSEQMTENEPQGYETAAPVDAKVEPGERGDLIAVENGPCTLGTVISPLAAARIQEIFDTAPLSSTLRGKEDSTEASMQEELAREPGPAQDAEAATPFECRIIRLLLETQQEQLRHSQLLLLGKKGPQAPPSSTLANVVLPNLPACTMDELDAAEAAVANSNVAAALMRSARSRV